MRHVLFYIFLLVFIGKPGDVFARWVSHLKTGTEQTSLDVQENGSVFNVRITGFEITDQRAQDADWCKVEIPGTDLSKQPGFPQLPVMYRLLEVPIKGDVHIEIHPGSMELMDLEKSGWAHPIIPVASYNITDASQPPVYDKGDVYRNDEFFPAEPVVVGGFARIRGKRYVRIDYYPLQYNPVTAKIRYYPELSFEVQHGYVPVSSKYPVSGFDSVLDTFVSNPQLTFEAVQAPPVLLVITPESFVNAITPLVTWKRQKGYNVTVATLAQTGSDTASIRQYIQNAYYTWENPPQYVLLAGGTEVIPAFDGGHTLNPYVTHTTDLYYGEMDGGGDVFTDLFVGRFPASSASELAIMVSKSLSYEQLNDTDQSWLDYATFIATQDENFYDFVQDGHRKSISRYFTPNSVSSDSIWTFDSPDKTPLNQAFERGTASVVYSGHGSIGNWSDLGTAVEPFNLVDIYYFNNMDRYPLVFSFGCNAGDYGQVECLGESWLKYENTGAALFLGSTDLSMWYQDYFLQDRLFNAIDNGGYSTISESVMAARFELFTRGYAYYDIYQEIYNILGDPTLPVWMGQPQALAVTAPDTLPANIDRVTVSVSSGSAGNALAAISVQGELLGSAYTQQGIAEIAIDRDLALYDNILLTVSQPGHETAIKSIYIDTDITITTNPTYLTVGENQQVEFHVQQSGIGPVPDFEIHVAGVGVSGTLNCITDENGNASLELLSLYGQDLIITGNRVGDEILLYSGVLPVQSGSVFTAFTVSAEPAIALDNILFMPGVLTNVTVTAVPEADSFYVSGCGLDAVYASADFSVIPQYDGELSIKAAKAGYMIQSKSFIVDSEFAEISGQVTQGEGAVPNPLVELNALWSEYTLSVAGDENGLYEIHDLPIGKYIVQLSANGFGTLIDTVAVNMDDMVFDYELEQMDPVSVQGHVYTDSGSPLRNASVILIDQNTKTVSGDDGAFEFGAVLPGKVRFYVNAPSSSFLDTLVSIPETGKSDLNFTLTFGTDEFFVDFESGPGLLQTDGLWQWGEPGPGLQFRGPETAFSGMNCWGTELDGDYTANADNSITTLPVDLDGMAEPFLEFRQYYQMDYLNSGFDGGNVKISIDDGATWTVLQPQAGYDCESLTALPNEPAFSGAISAWQLATFDLADYLNQTVLIRIHFVSTAQTEDAGWYIDDFKLYDKSTSDIENEISAPLEWNLSSSYPNPFNAGTSLEYTVPKSAIVDIAVYNVLGQKIRTLAHEWVQPGVHRVHWDGHTDAHDEAGSGMYLIKMQTDAFSRVTKVLLLR